MSRRRDRTSLVMLHGLLGSLDYFDPARLLPELDVHCPPMPGYGSAPALRPGEATLDDLVEHVVSYLGNVAPDGGPAWLLGHSVGGAVAMLAAHAVPELVAGIVNVEGNFTLKDAFWTSRIASLPEADWSGELDAMRADPAAWLRSAGIEPTAEREARAAFILKHQPASTVRAVSRAVVEGTRDPGYLLRVRAVLERGLPLMLVAGERSAAAWDVPDWVRKAASSYQVQPGTGHMMMLEDPQGFCAIVKEVVPTRAV